VLKTELLPEAPLESAAAVPPAPTVMVYAVFVAKERLDSADAPPPEVPVDVR
jgi:hypothetical protein